MKNLEKEIINRLNNILSKYGLKITINVHNLLDISYYLNDEITNNFICGWESIDEMLFGSSYSLFYSLNYYRKNILYAIQVDIKYTGKIEKYERYAAAYNNIKLFENSSCLEEFIIKCDLMGV